MCSSDLAGAEVEVLGRAPAVHWLSRSAWLHGYAGPLRGLLYPRTDVGPPGISLLVAHPDVFRRLPAALQPPLARRAIRPAASAWLRDRMAQVPITCNVSVRNAVETGDKLVLHLSNDSSREVDHALMATGYAVQVGAYPFLSPTIRTQLRQSQGYPELTRGLESSIPGLHFVGAPAAKSFGPLMRFVSGTPFAARAVTRQITGAA